MGSSLSTPITSKLVQRVGTRHFQAASADMQGFRFDFEDAHIMAPLIGRSDRDAKTSCFAVFDGHCGRLAADFLKANLLRYLQAAPNLSHASIEDLMIDLDAEFLSDENRRNDGSTSLFVLCRPRDDSKSDSGIPSFDLTVANVGDCRALLGHANDTFQALTEDHKPLAASEHERITKAGGTVVMGRLDGQLAVSRAVGDAAYKTIPDVPLRDQKLIALPTITTAVAHPGSYLLICCDGIFEQLSNEKVMTFVDERLYNKDRTPKDVDPADVCAALIDYSLDAGSTDNMTAMLIWFRDGTNYSRPDEARPGPYFYGRNDRKFCDAYHSDGVRFGFSPGGDPKFLARAYDVDLARNEVRQRLIEESFADEMRSYQSVIDEITAELTSGKLSALQTIGRAPSADDQRTAPYVMNKSIRKVTNTANTLTVAVCSIPGAEQNAFCNQAVAIVPSLNNDPNATFVAIIDSQPRPRRLPKPSSPAVLQQRSQAQSDFLLQTLPSRVQHISLAADRAATDSGHSASGSVRAGPSSLSKTLEQALEPRNKQLLETTMVSLFSSLNEDLLAHLTNQPAMPQWDDETDAPGPSYVGFVLVASPPAAADSKNAEFKVLGGNLGHAFVLLGRYGGNAGPILLSSTHNAHSVTQTERLEAAGVFPSSFEELATSFLGSAALLRRWEGPRKPYQHIVPHVATTSLSGDDFLVLCSASLCPTEDPIDDEIDMSSAPVAGTFAAPKRRPAMELHMRIFRFVSEELDRVRAAGQEPDPTAIVSRLMDVLIPVRANNNRASIVLILFHPTKRQVAVARSPAAPVGSSSSSVASSAAVIVADSKDAHLRTASFSSPAVLDHQFEPGPVWDNRTNPHFLQRYLEHARAASLESMDPAQLIRRGYEADIRLLRDQLQRLSASRDMELSSLLREAATIRDLKSALDRPPVHPDPTPFEKTQPINNNNEDTDMV